MGWDGTRPTHFKPNGKTVDRLAEVNARFNWENDNCRVSVVKSQMKGTTYYGAVCMEYKDHSKPTQIVGVVVLTSMRQGDFWVKEMDETMGPYYYDCPRSILELLSPTENEHAKQWRAKCYQKLNTPQPIRNCKEGDVIRFICPYKTTFFNEGEVVFLKKKRSLISQMRPANRKSYKWAVVGHENLCWRQKDIPDTFSVVSEKEAKAEKALRAWHQWYYPEYEHYEIVEDSYEYDDGLMIIIYADSEHEAEIDHYCVNISDYDKEDES